ncbi:hypothetical protein Thpro_020493 [Acidihalobacter prosperus]|uniref:Uncharacterized protein n=1 Tax=Acidihalobacter prosperus TaxID=160660 RepID=A0A1A6C882_9GAMM|nr:hypothetical protein Thpro_020493 [Acidihalobacter prosperus]
MSRYTATISHHSVSNARQIKIDGTLLQAKRAASREFGDGFIAHTIVILDERGEVVAARKIGENRWH